MASLKQQKMESQSQATWKRALKCGISLAVFAASVLGRLLIRLFGKQPNGACVVLYYHSVPPAQRRQFAKQLDVLMRHAKIVDVNGTVTLAPGVQHVGVTFDDAFENFVQCALPELEKRHIPATVFAISGEFGKNFGPSGRPEKIMSVEQMRKLPQSLVTIGSHTVSHPLLPSVSDQRAHEELNQSRQQLESILCRQIRLFSFPFGGFNSKLIDFCRDAGYERVFTTLPTFAFVRPDEFVVGRIRVDPTDWPLEFRLKLAGAYRWLPWAFAIKRKLLARRHEESSRRDLAPSK